MFPSEQILNEQFPYFYKKNKVWDLPCAHILFLRSRTHLPDVLKHTTSESALGMHVGLLTSRVSLHRWGRGRCAPLSTASLRGEFQFSTFSETGSGVEF